VHGCQATPQDLRLVADEEIPVVVCPRSNLRFGLTPPFANLQSAGVTTALGTDNAMLQDGDLWQEAAWAMTMGRLNTAAALRMATYQGRDLLKMADPELRIGRPADWIVLPEPSRPERRPGWLS